MYIVYFEEKTFPSRKTVMPPNCKGSDKLITVAVFKS